METSHHTQTHFLGVVSAIDCRQEVFSAELLIISVDSLTVREIREHMSSALSHYITSLSSHMICCYSGAAKKTENCWIYGTRWSLPPSKRFTFRYKEPTLD